MKTPSRSDSRSSACLAVFLGAALACWLMLAALGCGISVQDEKKDGNVDIRTPVGSLHVNTDIDPKDIGLALYPGARRVTDGGEHDSANVSISSPMFGVKVIAAKFETDDAPDKVLSFYRKDLDRFGKVLECPNGVDADVHEDQKDWSQEVRCRTTPETGRVSGEIDLAVGTRERHHLVNIKPEGKGTRFALAYIETRGQRQTM